MSDARAFWGTDEAPAPQRLLRAGPLEVVLEGAALRWVRLDGVEALRGVAFLVRDRDWGTLEPALTVERLEEGEDAFALVLRAAYASGGARLTARLTVEGRPDGLTVAAEAEADAPFETNRAGFSVLHPARMAGLPVRVVHGDGREEAARFPAMIDPWRPFADIRALTVACDGVEATCRLEGETFEMEDQRNWTDASFKTYCRPLELPWPYRVEPGAPLRQLLALALRRVSPAAAAPVPAAPSPGSPLQPLPAQPIAADAAPLPPTAIANGARAPQIALAVSAAEVDAALTAVAALRDCAPQRLLLTCAPGDGAAAFAAFARLAAAVPQAALDLECVVGSVEDYAAEIAAVAEAARGLPLASVMLCPAADRQSTPPGAAWPPAPPLEALYAAGRRAFGGLPLGGGMVSYFTELNRKRPPTAAIDFISWSTTPLVHAADDASVMETLEALPAVMATAAEIAGLLPRRIGPSTIAMRMNPYGAGVTPNPQRRRLCMAAEDPRQHAAFGAAWLVGYAAAIAPFGAEVWCPGPFAGPRGLIDAQGRPLPPYDAVRRLAALSGAAVLAAAAPPGGIAQLVTDRGALLANLAPHPATVEGRALAPYGILAS